MGASQGMGHRKMRSGAEYDVHRARDLYCYLQRTGTSAKIKAMGRRRERREAKRDLRRAD